MKKLGIQLWGAYPYKGVFFSTILSVFFLSISKNYPFWVGNQETRLTIFKIEINQDSFEEKIIVCWIRFV